jgi:hypothetical protein
MAESNFINLNNFDFIGENDSIKVFYLEAPLSVIPEKYRKKLASMMINIDGYHTGIGFVVNNKSFIIDYTATNGITNALLPDENSLDNGQLVWKNGSFIEIGNDKEQSWSNKEGYWKKSTYLSTINKEQFLELRRAILTEFLVNNTSYVFFGVKNTLSGKSLLRESICDNLPLFVIDKLSKSPINANFDFLTFPYISRTNILTNSVVPTKLDLTKDKYEIIEFYKMVYEKIKEEKNKLNNNIMMDIYDFSKNIDFKKNVFSQLFPDMKSIIYYSYDNDTNGKLSYYRFSVDEIQVSYSELNIPRNVTPITIENANTFSNDSSKTNSVIKTILVCILIIIICIIVGIMCFNCTKSRKTSSVLDNNLNITNFKY